jgi:hypothetical protein
VAVGDDGACEVQEGEVVLGFLLPADQESAVAVEPGEGAFHDPAFRLLGGVLGQAGGFVVAGFDERRHSERVAQFDHGPLAIAAVEADDATGRGEADRGMHLLGVECLSHQQEVGHVGGGDDDRGGDAPAVYQETAFRTLLGSVSGIGAGVGLLKGAFTIAVSSALGDHATPRAWS